MKRPTKPTPKPFDGTPMSVEDLIARLDHLHMERDAILDELRRQKARAEDAIRKAAER